MEASYSYDKVSLNHKENVSEWLHTLYLCLSEWLHTLFIYVLSEWLKLGDSEYEGSSVHHLDMTIWQEAQQRFLGAIRVDAI